MAIFSRKQSRAPARRSVGNDIDLKALRARARRRLLGALILVVAAVVVVPLLFDDPEPLEALETPLVLPAQVPPVPAIEPVIDAPEAASGDQGLIDEMPEVLPDEPADPVAAAQAPAVPNADVAPVPQTPPAPPARRDPAPSPSPDTIVRTDDGSLARALLEGPAGSAAGTAAATGGRYVVQAAAYSASADAQTRREKLIQAGISDAFVEQGESRGKTVYRLKVGPFPTQEAARAAQARLRSLGYDDSMLQSQ
ncbi:MAG: SPOR domain-containing protein [Castellaniella sp.]